MAPPFSTRAVLVNSLEWCDFIVPELLTNIAVSTKKLELSQGIVTA
jgi:hypothetical protein